MAHEHGRGQKRKASSLRGGASLELPASTNDTIPILPLASANDSPAEFPSLSSIQNATGDDNTRTTTGNDDTTRTATGDYDTTRTATGDDTVRTATGDANTRIGNDSTLTRTITGDDSIVATNGDDPIQSNRQIHDSHNIII